MFSTKTERRGKIVNMINRRLEKLIYNLPLSYMQHALVTHSDNNLINLIWVFFFSKYVDFVD